MEKTLETKFAEDMIQFTADILARKDAKQILSVLYTDRNSEENIIPILSEIIKPTKETKHDVFHINLAKIRKNRGLTHAELKNQIEVLTNRTYSPAYISALEIGRRLPSTDMLLAIITILDCDISDLYGYEI